MQVPGHRYSVVGVPARGKARRVPVPGVESQQSHRPPHSMAAHWIALRVEPQHRPPAAEERPPRVLFVDQSHRFQALRAFAARLVIQPRAVHIVKPLALERPRRIGKRIVHRGMPSYANLTSPTSLRRLRRIIPLPSLDRELTLILQFHFQPMQLSIRLRRGNETEHIVTLGRG